MKRMIKYLLSVSAYLLILECQVYAQLHPDVYLSLEDRVKRHGYPFEVHQVTTEDGYILSAYRVPYGIQKSREESTNRSAVLLMHGMGGSPHNWVLLGGKDSLPYYLADRGFDVWLVSVRGALSSFKKNHIKYDWNEDQEYWDFSLHEMGKYDLAANIDYIISHTNQSKVFFIGHSAGTPQFFILLSERPEYNKKIKIGVHYASAPILKRMEYSPALFLCSLVKVWRGIVKYLNMVELFPQLRMFVPMIISACQDPYFLKICVNFAGVIGTHKSVFMEDNIVAVAITALPRLSSKLLLHYVDNVNNGDFRQFNYGRKKNMKLYGQKDPPKYKLNNCLAPVAFFYGNKDSICVKSDIYGSMNELSNVILDYEVPDFTHIDFVVARNSTYLVYEPNYQLFKDFDEGKIPPKIEKKIIYDDL